MNRKACRMKAVITGMSKEGCMTMSGKRSGPLQCPKMMLIPLLFALLLLVMPAGCNLGIPKTPTTPAASAEPSNTAGTTPTAAAAATTTAAAPTSAASTTTANLTETTTAAMTTTAAAAGVTENRIGFVVDTSSGEPHTIDIDYVEMYFGAEAIAKAKEDGSDIIETDEDGKEFIPNDYYIRNNNPRIRTFEPAADCVIHMIPEMGGPDATLNCDFQDLHDAVADHKRLMQIEVVDGRVQKMTEIYTP